MYNAEIEPCANAYGFYLLHKEDVEEIGGVAYVFSHSKTGARLLYLANDDNNKGFSITFKTPASDDTGVFHILEHSVLCGSRKFPVKEPFVNLLKSSMQTFLNAMTFPDKTMYPVASTNERDLLNLADVYMDAVFHPNIYSNERIFEQEGWHYEIDEADGSLMYNGVVFNEMKGALSDPESVLYDTLSAALFPDTTYKFESGGDPKCIPTLTYESFLDAHSRHYHPSNSYVILYGNMVPDPFLRQIDGYLCGAIEDAAGAEGVNGSIREATPNLIGEQRPVVAEGIKKPMATAPENSCAALGFVAGRADERERMIATAVLVDAIMGSNEAPMKRALLDADIADDCDAFLADSILQPFVAITARGLHGEDSADRLREVVAKSASELAAGSLDLALVEAALSHAEFIMREGNFGYADGVMLSMASMNGWLYDDSPEAAVSYIRYEDAFASLRKKLEGDYFLELVHELFIDSKHHAQVEVVPVDSDEDAIERQKLDELAESMTPEELEGIAAETRALQDAQASPDDPADLAKLPRLSRSDVGDAPFEPSCEVTELGDMEVLRHSVETHGIAYATRFFDLSHLSFDDLPYVAILAMTLGKLDTSAHSAAEIDTIVQGKLGSLEFACEVFDVLPEGEDADALNADAASPNVSDLRTWTAKFTVGASALSKNVELAADLANEILLQTDFSDTGKLLDILVQRKVALEQRFAMAGNSVAASRAASYIFPSSVIRESIGGIDLYIFLKGIIDSYDSQSEALSQRLSDLCKRIFVDDGCLLSFAGTQGDYERFAETVALGRRESEPRGTLTAPDPTDRHEAFIVPSDVTYSALVADRWEACADPTLTGDWLVASKALTYDYLWNEVRVIGGAYGVGFSTARTGNSSFSSYRDPRIVETFDRFRASGEWLSSFEPSPEEFDGYVVSTAATFDKPMKPRELVRRQCSMHISGNTRENYLKVRGEVLASSLEGVRSLAPAIDALCESGRICVVGCKDIIEQAAEQMDAGLEVVDLLAL